MASASTSMSRKEMQKKKQLEQARQTGQAEPEHDEDGKMINPHNPEFISKRPWYLGDAGPSLKHHSVQKHENFLTMQETDDLLKKGRTIKGAAAITYRKGACKNCGAMGHNEKECLERPRSSKRSAAKTGLDLAPDEVLVDLEQHGKLSYDAKRDRWQAYDSSEQAVVIERYNLLEAERKKAKLEAKKLKQAEGKKDKKKKEKKKSENDGSDKNDRTSDDTQSDDSDSDSDSDSEYDSDEEDDEDETHEFIAKDHEQVDFQGRVARQGGVGGAQMSESVRNLRIREDTAKYLRNLDPNSAFYDPKTHSMRENPTPHIPADQLPYAGDNFIRHTGDALELASTQVFCWEAESRGEEINPLATPTQALLAHQHFLERKAKLEAQKLTKIKERYGVDADAQASLDPRLRLGQTEVAVTYTSDGKRIDGGVAIKPTTKYQEDVYINNHTQVWGSWYSRRGHKWGYACCHATVKNSYCTGDKGKEASQETEGPVRSAAELEVKRDRFIKRSDVFGTQEGDVQLDESKVLAAIRKQEEEEKRTEGRDAPKTSKRKRHGHNQEQGGGGYNSLKSNDVTPEDMEAYRLRKRNKEDPMAGIGSDELLEG